MDIYNNNKVAITWFILGIFIASSVSVGYIYLNQSTPATSCEETVVPQQTTQGIPSDDVDLSKTPVFMGGSYISGDVERTASMFLPEMKVTSVSTPNRVLTVEGAFPEEIGRTYTIHVPEQSVIQKRQCIENTKDVAQPSDVVMCNNLEASFESIVTGTVVHIELEEASDEDTTEVSAKAIIIVS